MSTSPPATKFKAGRTFSMAAQLKKGKAAEKDFMERYGMSALDRTDGRKGDFRIKWSRAVLELKADFYDSKNLFIERWSVLPTEERPEGKPGGPWQSAANGTSYFVYWMTMQDELFVFEPAKLAAYIDTCGKKFRTVHVRNKGYTTMGYVVPQDLFKVSADTADKGIYLGSSLDKILLFTP